MYVAASRLGAAAGLGLFAGVAYRRNDAITCYSGPLVYREQIPPDADTSYVLRLPNSGGKHIDGKPYADSIRSNPRNPGKDGRHFPVEGAKEWTAGAASMCNDPRQQHLYNARITFRKPQGASKALCELVPMRAVLLATRDIAPDEEAHTPPLPRSPTRRSDSPSRAAVPGCCARQIYFNYGSAKPFEHFIKEQQREEKAKKEREQLRNVCNYQWVPNQPAADPVAVPARK